MRSALAVAAVDLRVLRRDITPVLVMVIIPLLFVPFLTPGMEALLRSQGYPPGSGVQYVVPALAVLFALLNGQQFLTALYRDRHWGIWERLRLAGASTASVLLGKALPGVAVHCAQLLMVLGGGALLFGYHPTGAVAGIGLVALLFAVTMAAFALALFALCGTESQAMAWVNILGMAMAGLGGAFGPVSAQPHWMQVAALGSPAYWALRAITTLSLDGAPLREVAMPCVVLVGCAAVFFGAAVLALRVRSKESQ